MTDDERLERLAAIGRRLRQLSEAEAVAVWIKGLASAGVHEAERDRLIAATERLLDERDA
jgi:hypothetical protein